MKRYSQHPRRKTRAEFAPAWRQPEFDFDVGPAVEERDCRRLAGQSTVPDQPELPVGPDDAGYAEWHRRHVAGHREKIRRICELWGVPLFREVALTFRTIPGEYRGKLILVEYPQEPFDPRQPLTLAFDEGFTLAAHDRPQFQFLSSEIASGKVVPAGG